MKYNKIFLLMLTIITILVTIIVILESSYKEEDTNVYEEIKHLQNQNYSNPEWVINPNEINEVKVTEHRSYSVQSLDLSISYPYSWTVSENKRDFNCQNKSICKETNIKFTDPLKRVTVSFLFSEDLNSTDGSLVSKESLNNYLIMNYKDSIIGIPIYPGNFSSITNPDISCAKVGVFQNTEGTNSDSKYLAMIGYSFELSNVTTRIDICHNISAGTPDRKTLEELYFIIKSLYELN